MTVAVLVMTDGRDDLLHGTIEAWLPIIDQPGWQWMIHDDTGDRGHLVALREQYGQWYVVGQPGRLGFGGAIANAWRRLEGVSTVRYVLHLEDDFVPTQPVDIAGMVEVMDRNPHLVQMALRRQPWNDAERRAGGVVEQHPDDYTEVTDGRHVWLEHRRFFTTNPSIYRLSLCEREWPVGLESEGRFGLALFASDPTLRSAFWGARDSGVWVEHIGRERVGVGY